MGCAYDLGDQAPDEVLIDALNPTWEGGIQTLVLEKCDNCHGVTDSGFVPGNAKQLSFYFSRGEYAFDFYRERIKARVFDTPENPMPPSFATPLTKAEKKALKKFIER